MKSFIIGWIGAAENRLNFLIKDLWQARGLVWGSADENEERWPGNDQSRGGLPAAMTPGRQQADRPGLSD